MKKIYVILLTLICLMGFGLSFNKVEAAPETVTVNFGSADGSVNFNSSSKTFTDSNGKTWTGTVTGTTSFTPSSTHSQIGSSKKPADTITLSCNLGSETTITNVSGKFGGFSETAGSINYYLYSGSDKGTAIATSILNASTDVNVNDDLTDKTGSTLLIEITGIAKGVKIYNISYTMEAGANTKISTPSGITFENNNTLSWNSVSNASSYDVIIDNGTAQNVTTNSISLETLQAGEHTATIQAKVGTDSIYLDSDVSETFSFTILSQEEIIKGILNSITPSSRLGFQYNQNETISVANSTEITDVTNIQAGKTIVIVSNYNGTYYAMNADGTATEVTVAEGKITSTLNSSTFWTVENGTETNTFALKNQLTDKYIKVSSSLTTISYTSTSSKDNNVTISSEDKGLYISNGNRAIYYSSSKEFKHYSRNNIGSTSNNVTYSDSLHIFAYESTRSVEYVSGQFVFSFAVESSIDSLINYDVDDYGIYVSAGSKSVYYSLTVTNFFTDEENGLLYVTIDLGDVVSNIDRASVVFTYKAYVKIGENYSFSSQSKTQSVKSIVKNYYDKGTADVIEKVADLYDILTNKGCYNAQ